MKGKAMMVALAVLLALPALAGAVTEKDFEVKTTQNLIDLCTAPAGDPLYNQAVNFCHGFLVGAFQYYAAASAGPDGVTLVCFPEPPPTRNEAIGQFVAWAKAHPQFMGEKPVDTEFRFLTETWPCK